MTVCNRVEEIPIRTDSSRSREPFAGKTKPWVGEKLLTREEGRRMSVWKGALIGFGRTSRVSGRGRVGGRVESLAYSRGFTRVGGHGCFLNHSLPLHTTLSPEPFSLFPRPRRLSSLPRGIVIAVVTSPNNVPNDRLFSSGDIDLPANRKPVKMNPFKQVRDQLCNSFSEECGTNKSSLAYDSNRETFRAKDEPVTE